MTEVIEYIKRKGWTYREVGHSKEINVKVCPFCYDKNWHFYINTDTGQYICHHGNCQQAGSLYTLKRHMGDAITISSFQDMNIVPKDKPEVLDTNIVIEAYERLLEDAPTILYLLKRKFSWEAIKYFKLGVEEENGIKWLLYPYFKDGKLLNIKKRSLNGPRIFRRQFGGESILFNSDILKENLEEVVITEGESDAISLWSTGFQSVLGASVGAGGIKTEWIDQLDKVQKIYFVYDSDEAGQRGAYKFADRLGLVRCYNIRLPAGIKDLNEFFRQGNSLEDFLKLKAMAKIFDIENVRSFKTLLEDAITSLWVGDRESEGLALPWSNLQKLTGTWKSGDLIVLAAKPGVGKTMMAVNMLYHYATHNVPSLLFELEMRIERLIPRIVSLHRRKDTNLVNNMEDLKCTYNDLKEIPLYFAYKYKRLNWLIVEETIRGAAKRYGLQFIVFDNIHFLVRSEEQTKEISLVINNLKLLAEELGVVLVAIARPRKVKGIMDSQDLKDSADIEGDADYVIILNRQKFSQIEEDNKVSDGIFVPTTLVRVDKARWEKGGDCYLTAVDAQCRFDQSPCS